MIYREPLQRSKDKKWDYTETHDGHSHPTGYCATKCNGHETRKEAEECYRIYKIDNANYHINVLDEDKRDQHKKCKICGKWTMSYAQLDPLEIYDLCPDHLDRESLLEIVPLPGYSASSW
jgi:hypothetical protein